MNAPESIFNTFGDLNEDFIAEVTDVHQIKRNEVFFALFVNGLPGEPDFGLGLPDLVFEQNAVALVDELKERAKNTMPDLVDGIAYKGMATKAYNDMLAADIRFTDLQSRKDILLPVGFRKR